MGKIYTHNILNSVQLPNNATYDLNDISALHYLGVGTVTIENNQSTGAAIVINGDTAHPVTLAKNDAVTVGTDNVLYAVADISGEGDSATITWNCLSPNSAAKALTDITINNESTGVTITGHTADLTINAATIAIDGTDTSKNALPNGVTATTQTRGDGSTKVATTAYVDTAVAELPQAMIFRGTLGESPATIQSLPTASADYVGDTYKVTTAGTYDSQAAQVGDLFICGQTGSGEGASYAWNLIPSGDVPAGTVTEIAASTGLTTDQTSGGVITTSGTIKMNLTSETALADTATAPATTAGSGRVFAVALDGAGHPAVNVTPGTLATTVSDVTNDDVVKTIAVADPASEPSGLAYYEVSGTTLTLKQITTTTANNGVFGTAPTPPTPPTP